MPIKRKPAKVPSALAGTKRSDDSGGFGMPNSYFTGGGLTNLISGLGSFGRDKIMQATYWDSIRISDMELSSMFHGNDLAARIVELRPREMFRKGFCVTLPDPSNDDQDPNAETAEEIEEYANNLRLKERLLEGMIWGRLYGGALVILGVDDGRNMAFPVNEGNIRSIRFANVVDRRFAQAKTYYNDLTSPKYGDVETYAITSAFGGDSSIIHESRCIRFDGAATDSLKKRSLAGWTFSVLQRAYDTLRQFDTSFQAASNLVVDASQAVFKIQGLIDQIASGNLADVQTRMALSDMMRSAGRAVLLDAGDSQGNGAEDFHREPTSFAGLPDMIDRFMQRVSSAADMPVSILFGRSVAGLNATGEADFRAFYGGIATEQKNMLEPLLIRAYRLICLAKDSPCSGVAPVDGIEINFESLWEPTDLEQAQTEAAIGARDVAYVSCGILQAEEVALSRFRTGVFNMSTNIDVEARKKSLAAELDFSVQASEKKAEDGPPDLPDPNAALKAPNAKPKTPTPPSK